MLSAFDSIDFWLAYVRQSPRTGFLFLATALPGPRHSISDVRLIHWIAKSSRIQFAFALQPVRPAFPYNIKKKFSNKHVFSNELQN